MQNNFGGWYRLVSIDPTHDMLKKRWAGVEECVSSIRGDDDALLETVRIFRGLPKKTSREKFLVAFREHDAAFAERDNELEQRVLAGATLVHCVVRGRDEADDTAGARAAVIAGTAVEASLLCAPDNMLEELTAQALAGLHEIALLQRNRSGFSTLVLTAGEKDASIKMLEQIAVAEIAQLRTHVATVLQTFLKAVNRSESALKGAAHDLRCADEETNILWWLMGGVSRDLDKSWSMLKEAAPLVAGWELADLTDVALGPQNAAALLDRVVLEAKLKSKEQPLHLYVNAVPEEWAEACAAKLDERALDLTPLSLALSYRSKSSASTWQSFFEANSGLKAATALAPDRAARQAYIEAVLFNTLAKAES